MTEVQVSDWQRSVAWYGSILGLRVVLEDRPGQFALLEVGQGGGRVALKGGAEPVDRGSVRLVFEVDDLEPLILHLTAHGVEVAGPKVSGEGYREITLHDPDGTPIGVFAWVRPDPEGDR